MRRLMAIAAFALFLAVPVWAQHGGGHGGGGGHAGGFGGGHSGGFAGHSGFSGGHVGGGRSFGGGGMRSPGVSRGFSRVPSSRFLSSRAGFSRNPFLHNGFRDHDRFRGSRFRDLDRDRRFRDFGFRRNCFGFPCRGSFGWPWYAGYWDPWWWWNSDSDYDQSYNDNLALAQQMNEQNLEEQRMLRQEEADGDRDAYAHSDPAPRPAVNEEKQGTPIVPATVLVFRDQHRQEVDNYAIVGQTLWVFAPKQAGKIALVDLDVAATVKANEDRGVAFRLPVANEAQ